MDTLKPVSFRITVTLFFAQSFSSAAIIALAAVVTIIATRISGNESLAGLPTTITNLAAAPAAFGFGLLWDRIGRRWGLAVGLMFGVVGAALSLWATEGNLFLLLLLGMAGLGAGRAAIQLGRFIAAEVNPPSRRGLAISTVVWGGTIGAVGGPLLVEPASQWGLAIGLDPLAGPVAAAIVLQFISVLVALIGLNPEPMELGKQIAEMYPEEENGVEGGRGIPELLRNPAVLVAMAAIVFSQMVMIMVMGMTSLHMDHAGHSLKAISQVFSAHTLGMFAFAPLTGFLTDKWGRSPVILTGGVLLMASFIIAPTSTAQSVLGLSLFLLGLGWNFAFVAGSSLLADQLSPSERSRMQGFNDVFLGLVAAGGSFASGLVLASAGFGMLNLIGAVITVIWMLGALTWAMRERRQVTINL